MSAHAVCFKLFIFSLFIFDLKIGRCVADVQHLTKDNFQPFIDSNQFVLVLFKSSSECSDCEEAQEELGHIEHPAATGDALKLAFVADESLGKHYGITNHPALVFFRHGSAALFDGQHIAADNAELNEWLELSVHEGIKILTDDTFEHLTQASTGATTGDWFVVFYTPSCDTCMKIFPVVETVALRKRVTMNFAKVDLKHGHSSLTNEKDHLYFLNRKRGTMNFAKVDMEHNKKLVDRFKITTHLKGILFKKGKMYEFEPGKFDAKSVTSFVDYWYMNVQGKPVPIEASTFDRLTDSIAMNLKESFRDPTKKTILIAIFAAIVIICVAMVYKMVKKPSEGARFKYDKTY